MSFSVVSESDSFLMTVADGRGIGSGTGSTFGSVVVVDAMVLVDEFEIDSPVDEVDAFTEQPASVTDTTRTRCGSRSREETICPMVSVCRGAMK